MNKYTALGIVGEGTYGMVLKCMNKITGLPVAVKKLRTIVNSYHCDMIVREINLLRMLDNEHVVPLIEVFRLHGYVYMVFPFMRCNLYRHLELKGGALTIDDTRKCVYQVLKGLNYVHGLNVLHRDVKPENVLLSAAGVVKICDFGVSRLFYLNRSLNMSTEIGTVWYQAPEILMESKTYNAMADIWSIGILFTELISKLPLVTESTIVGQLYGIAKILDCEGDELAVINNYLSKHNVSLNIVSQKVSLSKSYTVVKTALALRNVYVQWPTHLLEIVAHCLQLNPANRKSAAQLMNMEFFTVGTFTTRFAKELEIKLERDQNIMKYK